MNRAACYKMVDAWPITMPKMANCWLATWSNSKWQTVFSCHEPTNCWSCAMLPWESQSSTCILNTVLSLFSVVHETVQLQWSVGSRKHIIHHFESDYFALRMVRDWIPASTSWIGFSLLEVCLPHNSILRYLNILLKQLTLYYLCLCNLQLDKTGRYRALMVIL